MSKTHPAMASPKPGARLVFLLSCISSVLYFFFPFLAAGVHWLFLYERQVSQIWSDTHVAYLRVQVFAAAACKECRGKGAVECEGCKV
jgi:hypothetical protein